MWFGGPNQALSGHPDEIRESNDAHFALCKEAPEMPALLRRSIHMMAKPRSKRSRASPPLGFKVLKLHRHTQKFDPSDPRVLAVVTRAGNLA